MFTVIILVQAISTDWSDVIEVNPKYPSFELCEAARPGLESSYKDFVERQRMEPVKIQSKCVADKSAHEGAWPANRKLL
jgi:hypothetical protein